VRAGLGRSLRAGRLRRLVLPDFLGIGAPQSGTTWLYENLRAHPGLYLPRPKEVHFFDRHFERGVAWYADHFRGGRGRVVGEVTPSYGALRRDRIRTVRELLPDVRLLYVLRDPVERAWSRARRRFARTHGGGEAAPGLRELRAYEAEQSIAPGDYEPGVMKGDHARILEHWLAVFPAERLLLLRFEDVAGRPRALLEEVFAHLGVAAPAEWSGFPLARRVNANPPAAMPADCRAFLEERYAEGIARLRARFGLEIATGRGSPPAAAARPDAPRAR
jgi:hypothetical protein